MARKSSKKKTLERAQLRFIKSQDFLDRFLPDVGPGGFQWETTGRKIDEELLFEISFVGYPKRFEIAGKIVWSQSSPPMRPHLPSGAGVEFDPSEKKTIRKLVQYATGSIDGEPLKALDDRVDRRLRVSLDCEYLFGGKLVREKVLNISTTGLYIETEKVFEEGGDFIFLLYDEGLMHPQVMEGTVVWANPEGDRPCFGVQFVFDSRNHKTEVAKFVNRMGEAFEDEDSY